VVEAARIAALIVVLLGAAVAWQRWLWPSLRGRVLREDIDAKWGCFSFALVVLILALLVAIFSGPSSAPRRVWERLLPSVIPNDKRSPE